MRSATTRERLALLPGLGTRYAHAARDAEPRTRADFGLPEDRTLYLVPQSLFKIHPDNDALIARVLAARSARRRGDVRRRTTTTLTQRVRARGSAAALAAHGLDVHERVLLPRALHAARARTCALNELCDVMLDTLHWSGGNTSLDALAMRAAGGHAARATLMRGRQSLAMLRIAGPGRARRARRRRLRRRRPCALGARSGRARARSRERIVGAPRRALRARRADARARSVPRARGARGSRLGDLPAVRGEEAPRRAHEPRDVAQPLARRLAAVVHDARRGHVGDRGLAARRAGSGRSPRST